VGLGISHITPVLPDFRYRAVDASGVVENEICPVFTARTTGEPSPRADEISEWEWVEPETLHRSVSGTPFAFSPWLVLQLEQWPGVYDAD
jgi:Isopentenyldiphosphate isomerase